MRIESLETFGTPEEVGARVLKVEQGKDGTLDTKLFDTRAEKQGDLSLYTLVRNLTLVGSAMYARHVDLVSGICVRTSNLDYIKHVSHTHSLASGVFAAAFS